MMPSCTLRLLVDAYAAARIGRLPPARVPRREKSQDACRATCMQLARCASASASVSCFVAFAATAYLRRGAEGGRLAPRTAGRQTR